jgi:ABC-type multidrug transport system, ATPase component
MSQSFSLYGELTVRQNLALHARLFHMAPDRAERRIRELVRDFGLAEYVDAEAAGLPLGIRQRLSLAVAVVHEPELLILDEPTSGVDPLARDRFWELLADLSRNKGVTIFVSTHFMNEAARCDRVSLMDSGRVLATGTPADLVAARAAGNLEEAFIGYIEDAVGTASAEPDPGFGQSPSTCRAAPSRRFSLGRLLAYSIRESLELWRDPVRLGFALLGTAFLMLALGTGINTDVDHLPFAALDRDDTPESRAYLEELRGSIYFTEQAPLADYGEIERRLAGGELKVVVEIPPGFGRDLRRGRPVEVGAWIDGAMPFRAETTRGYLESVHQRFLADLQQASGGASAAACGDRNQVPLQPGLQKRQRHGALHPGDAAGPDTRDPDGSCRGAGEGAGLDHQSLRDPGHPPRIHPRQAASLYRRGHGELPHSGAAGDHGVRRAAEGQLPRAGRGRPPLCDRHHRLWPSHLRLRQTQIAALFGTAILTVLPATQFSGMLTPVSSLSGLPAVMGHLFPMTYFLPISVGTFTKSLGFAALGGKMAALALFVPALTLLSLLLLRKQAR